MPRLGRTILVLCLTAAAAAQAQSPVERRHLDAILGDDDPLSQAPVDRFGDARQSPSSSGEKSTGGPTPPISSGDDRVRPANHQQPIAPGAPTAATNSSSPQAGQHSSAPSAAGRKRVLPRKDQPSRSAADKGPLAADPSKKQLLPSLTTVLTSLGFVVGLFLCAIWLVRRGAPQGAMKLPREIVDVLGRAPLAGRQQVYLVRCGNKLLLVSLFPAGMETLTEITDPLEVDRIAGICQQVRPNSSTQEFQQILAQFHDQAPPTASTSTRAQVDFSSLDAVARRDLGREERHGV